MICGSGGSKSRLAKAAGAEPAGQMSDEKLHAVVARSTFRSQNVQSTSALDHFWKLRCRKIARRCGAKHISKSKCRKHLSVGPLLEVEMSKKCTPLWREAHVEVKMYKTRHVRATFGGSDVEKVHAVVARSTFRSQNVQNTTCSRHFWRLRCRKKCTPLGREAHFEVKSVNNTEGSRTTFGGSDVEKSARRCARSTCRSEHVQYTTCTRHFWRFRCRFASLHYQYTTLHYTTLHSTTLHYITLHYTPQHYSYNYTTTLHYTKLDYTTLHYITLHYTALPSTTLHYILHYTTVHSTTTDNYNYTTTRHYTPLH